MQRDESQALRTWKCVMKTRGRSRIGAAAIAAGVLVLVSASAASAHHRATRVEGTFSMTVVGGEAYTSPISLCTHATLSGDLPGSYDAVFDSLATRG